MFEYHMFYVLYQFVPYLLTLPSRNKSVVSERSVSRLYTLKKTQTKKAFSSFQVHFSHSNVKQNSLPFVSVPF
jgi:hypothetical protein